MNYSHFRTFSTICIIANYTSDDITVHELQATYICNGQDTYMYRKLKNKQWA